MEFNFFCSEKRRKAKMLFIVNNYFILFFFSILNFILNGSLIMRKRYLVKKMKMGKKNEKC